MFKPWKAASKDISESDQSRVKVEKCKSPWLITRVQNGLKAINGEPTRVRFAVNKKFPVQYFEYDRIYGRNAFSNDGIMKVDDLFGELQSITPRTEYFIFDEWSYYAREDGILAKNRETNDEMFLSNETIANQAVSIFLRLDEPSKHGRIDEDNGQDDQIRGALPHNGSEYKAIEGPE